MKKKEKKYLNILGRIQAMHWLLKMNITLFLPIVLSILSLSAAIFEKVVGKGESGGVLFLITIVSICTGFLTLIINLCISIHKQNRIICRTYSDKEIAQIIEYSAKDDYQISRSNNSILLYSHSEDEYVRNNIQTIIFKYNPKKRYYPPYDCKENAYFVFMKNFNTFRHFNNGKKIRLMTDIDALIKNKSNYVELTKTTYFNSNITNEMAFNQLKSEKDMHYRFDGKDLLLDENNNLIPLSKSYCSNHIGVSTLMITSDNKIIILRQANGNKVDHGKYIVSGSGSMDLNDKKKNKKSNFGELIVKSMERELREECNIPKSIELSTKVVGYGRLINRGAKPEFFGITFAKNYDSELAIKQIKCCKEVKNGYISEEVNCFDLDKEVCDKISSRLDNSLFSVQLKHYLETFIKDIN